MKKIVITLSVLFFSSPLYAADIYVDGAHSGTENGASWSTPYNTIAEGIAQLDSGETLWIKTGTYAEGISVSGEFGSRTSIKTDDGSGNPGVVTLTGRVSTADGYYTIALEDPGDLTIDGRQSVIEGDASAGFILDSTSAANGIYVDDYSGTSCSLKLLRMEFAGANDSGEGQLNSKYCEDVEYAYLDIHQTGTISDGLLVISESGRATQSGSIHHNHVHGISVYGGYGAITTKRLSGVNIYNNYIYGITGGTNYVGLVIRDWELIDQDGGDVYNNVFISNGAVSNAAVQIRGTDGSTGGSDNMRIFNNTVVVSTGGFADGAPFMVANDSDGNQIFNNLVIGNLTSWVSYCCSAAVGSGNSLSYNHATGTVGQTFHNSTVGDQFTTSTPNYASAGTSFLTLSGSVPSPYYDLDGDKNGTGTIPATDYDGNARSDPPDVGAFEYGEASADETPPAVSGLDPAASAINVSKDTDIVAHITDAGDGVDQSTIIMTVAGSAVTPTISGTSADYTLTYNPASDFAYEQVVNVTIDADDLAANSMTQYGYSFTILPNPGVTSATDMTFVGVSVKQD